MGRFCRWALASALAMSAVVDAPAGAAARPSAPTGPEVQASSPQQGSPQQGARDLASCGRPGQPLCPMQAWMKSEVGAPLGEGKLAPVASALHRLASEPPDPAWALWRSSASDGAAAAAKNDMAAVRQSCRTCHDAYRTEYRKRFRTRPPPP